MIALVSAAALAFAATAPATGPSAGQEPCGYVDFIAIAPPRTVEGTSYETIRAIVSFSDGHTERVTLPWRWVYPNGEQTDPWSYTNLRDHPNDPVTFQTPPPDVDRSTLPPLVAYIIAHTDANGRTTLRACPPVSARFRAINPEQHVHVDVGSELSISPFARIADAPNALVRIEQCVAFTNRSPRTVRRIGFRFTPSDAGGTRGAPTLLVVDGPFGTGQGTPDPHDARTAAAYPACVRLMEARSADAPAISVRRVETTVDVIDYTDGTSWRPLSRP